MKKLKRKQREQQIRRARSSWRRTLRTKRLRQAKRRAIPAERRHPSSNSFTRQVIDAPECMSFSLNYESVVAFFEKLRQLSLRERRFLLVNFVPIRNISPAANLVLAAEIDRWRRTRGARLRPYDLAKWDPDVKMLMQEVGFFELLSVRNPNPEASGIIGQTRLIRLRSGHTADGSLALQLRQAIEEIAGPLKNKRSLYIGLTEAMANACHHAYPDWANYRWPILSREWWMTGSCDQKAGKIQVIFLDQGVGIPATLPRSTLWERVREKVGLLLHDDGEMIRAAMAIGRTGTAVQGRGKGLAQIRRFVEVSGGGRLRIFSGRGEYLYGTQEGERVTNHRSPFSGTLIEWEVPLEFWRGQ